MKTTRNLKNLTLAGLAVLLSLLGSASVTGQTAATQTLLHQTYRQQVAKGLLAEAKRTGIIVDASTFFMNTSGTTALAGMYLGDREKVTDKDFEKGVDMMLVWFSTSKSRGAPPEGYYLIRGFLWPNADTRSFLVGLTHRWVVVELVSNFYQQGGCQEPHIEPNDDSICINNCFCELYAGQHVCGSWSQCFVLP